MNPNNCTTCDHSKHPDGGHCYMFREEPREVCYLHTLRSLIAVKAIDKAKEPRDQQKEKE